MSRAVTEQILTQSRRLVGVQRFKMAKIDPVSPFYPTLIGKGILQWENLQEVQENLQEVQPLGCKYLPLCVSKLEVFAQLPPAYHENS